MDHRKQLKKCAKKLMGAALDNFYFFDDEEIEERIDRTLIKCQGRNDWRKEVRKRVLSDAKTREKVQLIAGKMYGLVRD